MIFHRSLVKFLVRFTIASIFFVIFISCSTVNNEEAKGVFLRENPEYTVLNVVPGEGNGDAVYYHFKFKKPNDEVVYEEVWLFENRSGEWRVTHTESVNNYK